MITIGIDPGASGAITVMEGNRVLESIKTDSGYHDLHGFLNRVIPDEMDVHAYIERVSASPGAGVSGMFRFGQSFGALQMLLTCHHIPFDLVSPLKWQQAMGCARPKVGPGEKKESQTEHKNRTKQRAQQLFPDLTIIHATADSILLAEYGRRLRAGEIH